MPRRTLTLENGVIHDDPAFGLEPLAYVSKMELGVSISGLLRGRFEFSRIRLVRPSVNLARSAGRWNFPPLLGNRLGPGGDVERAPRIEVRDGRLNFKFSDTKSVFYLSAADVDIVPLTGGEAAVSPLTRLAGGVSRETWAFELTRAGSDAPRPLILRMDTPRPFIAGSRGSEFALIRWARAGGEDESRAWPIRRGTPATRAAGVCSGARVNRFAV